VDGSARGLGREVAGGRSRVESARQRGRRWSQSSTPDTSQRPGKGRLSWGFAARREGFEPPTARSVVWGRLESPASSWKGSAG
jgi:hypothetical protein